MFYSQNKNPPTYVLVETVGRAIPCFRHGTDYILNLHLTGPPASYARCSFIRIPGSITHPSTARMAAYKSIHGCWIAPHTTRHCLIAIHDLGFTDKAGFSLACCHARRLITNRTHVQRYWHLSFYECSRHIGDSLVLLPTDRRPAS